MTTLPPAPEAIIHLMKERFANNRCKCRKAALTCTDLCGCSDTGKDCKNKLVDVNDDECKYEDDDVDDDESEYEKVKVVSRMDTPKYGETLKFVYIKYQPILVKSCQRFTKFNYGVTRTIYES